MKKWVLLFAGLFLAAVSPALAEVRVSEGLITTEIVNRNPVDVVETYSSDVGKLFCFTRIEGVAEETFVTHVWFYGDREMAQVNLPVRSSGWRTYSSKNIRPEWKGQWRVEVRDARGNLLMNLPFQLI